MLRSGPLLAVLLLMVAGCAAPLDEAPPTLAPASAVDGTQEATAIPGDRPIVASMRMHEEFEMGSLSPQALLDPDAKGYEPRDFDVTYHGVQEIYDEFARPVKAFVYRSTEMVYIQQVSFGVNGFSFQGHWEEHAFEYAFDASDGRSLGVTDLTDQVRAFEDPQHRHPYASLHVLFMTFHALGEERSREVAARDYEGSTFFYRFEPVNDEPAPLPGDCGMWRMAGRIDPPLQTEFGEVHEDASPFGLNVTACLETGREVPLWVFGDLGDSEYRLQRISEPVVLPPLQGEPLPAVSYETASWGSTATLALVPGQDALAMRVPPTSPDGTWGRAVADRAAAFHLNPTYIQYRQGSDMPYPGIAWVGLPSSSISVGNITIPLGAPVMDSSSLFIVTDGKEQFVGTVHSREGSAEEPDVHVADPLAFTSDDYFGSWPADRLPALVLDGPMQGQLDPLLPVAPTQLLFFASAFGADDSTMDIVWMPVQDCTPQDDGFVAAVNGLTGALVAVAIEPADPQTCDEPQAFPSMLPRASGLAWLSPGPLMPGPSGLGPSQNLARAPSSAKPPEEPPGPRRYARLADPCACAMPCGPPR